MSGTNVLVMVFFFKIARQAINAGLPQAIFRMFINSKWDKLHLEFFSKCSLEQKLTYLSMHVYLSALNTWVTYSAYLYDIVRHNNSFIQQLLS